VLSALSLCTCCRHYPGAATGGTASLIHPVVSAFPERVTGSACASAFSRLAQRSLALRPAHSRCHQFVTRLPEGFSHFVTSMTAPAASGWSVCRAGLTPAGKRRLFTAHTHFSPSIRRDVNSAAFKCTIIRAVMSAGNSSAILDSIGSHATVDQQHEMNVCFPAEGALLTGSCRSLIVVWIVLKSLQIGHSGRAGITRRFVEGG
jgi:hypothetical protein